MKAELRHNLPFRQIAEERLGQGEIQAVAISFLITMIPHFFNLPVWVSVLALSALAWRNLQAVGHAGAIPRWLLVIMVVVGGISVFAQFWTIAGRDPGLALLTVMTAFKFLEARTHRDLLILIFLSYFLLATHFLFDQSMLIAAFMFMVLIIITATLITVNQRDNQVPIKTRLLASARLIGLSIPIMLILFILVPRIPGPLWGLTEEQRGGITGLSDTMSPGEISDLITSNEVAFRVTFDDAIPAQSQLYWRGPVMLRFDGRRWSQARTEKFQSIELPADAQLTRYTVILEPHGRKWLFGLDLPATIPPKSQLTAEYQLVAEEAINDMKKYDVASILNAPVGLDETFDYLAAALEYDENRNPQTIALGRQWANRFDSDDALIRHALRKFNTEQYVYTLQPPLLGEHPSDEFLFQTRQGFCEHYASSFTLLMRAAGIPARVVTGYQGGETNQAGNYLIVRQSDAHAWSEVYLEDRGWVRVDPTAAVSPDRIENGLDLALRDSDAVFRFSNRNAIISRMLFAWDNMQYSWSKWVLNYDHRRQSSFLRDLGLGIRSWGDMVIALVLCLVVVTGAYAVYGWYRDRPPPAPRYEQLIKLLLKKLHKAGMTRHPSEPLEKFLRRIEREHGIKDPQLQQIFDNYTRIKYARGYDREVVLRRFEQLVSGWKLQRG
jgi:transglutaminase-like putative cysteine protease